MCVCCACAVRVCVCVRACVWVLIPLLTTHAYAGDVAWFNVHGNYLTEHKGYDKEALMAEGWYCPPLGAKPRASVETGAVSTDVDFVSTFFSSMGEILDDPERFSKYALTTEDTNGKVVYTSDAGDMVADMLQKIREVCAVCPFV